MPGQEHGPGNPDGAYWHGREPDPGPKKGFGFVELEPDEDTDAATDGLTITEARPPEERPGRDNDQTSEK